MTGVPAIPRGSVGRRGARSPSLSRPVGAGTFLIALLVFGLLLRLFIAGPYLPFTGFRTDMVAFTGWAMRLADTGPGAFYAPNYFSDYPPGYMYVLWGLGTIGQALQPLFGVDITRGLVKLPGILADIGVAALLFALCKRFAHQLLPGIGEILRERLALVAAAVYLLNPGVIFNSAVWGQIDSVGSLVLLGTIYLLARGWTEVAAVTAVVALLIKFQFAFLIPVVAVVGLKRHLFGRSSDPAHDARPEPIRVLSSLAVGLATLVILILPFGMTIWAEGDPGRSLIGKFVEAANTYTGLVVNALNPWRLPFTGPTGPLPGYGDTLHGGTDTIVLFSLGALDVTAQIIGATLFALAAVLALWQVARRDDGYGILLAALLLAIAFFVLPTRVHERYLFPALVLAAPLILRGPRWAVLYVALSFFFLANVYWVYTADWSFVQDAVVNPGALGQPMLRDPFLASTLFSDAGVFLLSAAVAIPLAWVAWRSFSIARTPETNADVVSSPFSDDESPSELERPLDRPIPAAADAMTVEEPVDEPMAPSWSERIRWLRRDPDDPLYREPGRRLDRLDAALVLGLVVLAFAFRLWHLDMPRGMHFDEIYHARSASEWLADWQHGWRRDVYEWTHPMLAKYLIAAGIVVADPNKVTDEDALDAPSPALAVAPRRTASGFERSVAFTAGSGDEVVARDLQSDEIVARWSAGGQVAALAYDEDHVRLLVGLATTGTIATYDLNAFLSAEGERGPPASAASLDSGLDAVSQIVVPRDGDMVLVRGPTGIASLERATGGPLAGSEQVAGGIGYLPGDADTPPLAAVTDPARNAVVLLDAATLAERTSLPVEPPLIGPMAVRGSGDDQQVFALTGTLPANGEHPAVAGGLAVVDADREALVDVAPLPGSARLVGWQPVANVIYAAGIDADGEPAVWTIQPQGEARRETSAGFAPFDATPLPGEPLALAFDVSRHAQEDDAAELLVATAAADGARLVTIDAGSNAFAWRLAGVLFGSILVGLVYLLAATMFSRRRIAVLAGAFIAFDGMSLVMSRIAMNDIFVAVFIVAAYLLFWQVWSGRWGRSAWWALPLVGVLIGLAAASKWVGFYALAGLWVLTLARSELGRLVLVGLIALVAVVAGIGAPWPFTLVVVAALALALVLVYRRPIRLDLADVTGLAGSVAVLAGLGAAFGLAYGSVAGAPPGSAVEVLFSLLARGAEAGWPVLVMLAIGAVLIVARAVRSLTDSDADRRWFEPGELGGFGWAWVGAALLIIPLTVYGLSYLPYLQLGHAFAIPDTGPGYHWSLDELHRQMFGYHYGLTASHVAASPWWSWPLDLKTVWFFSGDYDGQRTAVIYNGGNPLLFWAGVPAIIACGILAWRRRSLALALLVAAFAFQFLPWTRIERATFIYHYLTAVLFAMVAVAYLVDELLRRPQWRELGVAYLAAAAVAGIVIFPLGWALPMPDWYINAARSLPPWNYYFVFPDPPQGERADLVAADTARLVLGLVVSAAAVVFALVGRDLIERRRSAGSDEEGEVGEPATETG